MTTSLIVALALVVGAPAKKEPAAKDPPTLFGEWTGETAVRGGKQDNPPPGTTITFLAEGKLIMKEGGDDKAEEGTYKADAKKDPAEIDITPPGKGNDQIMLGIYRIEGDTLTLCITMSGERPKTFDSPAGSMAMVITCKRAKKD